MKKKTPTKKSDAVKTGTETASANSGALSNLLNKLRPSSTAPMNKLIPIKCIEEDKFKMQDDSYMDIVQIVTKDLNSASESDLETLIAAWARMYRTNGFDIKLVSLNTPTSRSFGCTRSSAATFTAYSGFVSADKRAIDSFSRTFPDKYSSLFSHPAYGSSGSLNGFLKITPDSSDTIRS